MVNNGKRSLGALLIAFCVLVVVAITFLIVILPVIINPTTNLILGDGVFRADLALNNDDRTQGLSGVTKLDSDQAMIMAFPGDGKWRIWMKAMNFPIDIVWLNSAKMVVHVVKNASPNSYPKLYEPKYLARYVLELPEGTVDKKAITIGDVATFQINTNDVK